MSHETHKQATMQKIQKVAKGHKCDLQGHEPHIQDILGNPAVTPLWDALDKGAKGDKAGAIKDGDAQLMRTIVISRGIADQVFGEMGGTPSELAKRWDKALNYALTGTMPV